MNLQRAEKLIPASEPGGLIEVQLANGAHAEEPRP